MDKKISIPLSNDPTKPILLWAQKFRYCYYTKAAHDTTYPHEGFKHQLAVSQNKIALQNADVFAQLNKMVESKGAHPLFGYLSYELQQETHQMMSQNKAVIDWDLAGFFQPEVTIHFYANRLELSGKAANNYMEEIGALIKVPAELPSSEPSITNLSVNCDKSQYIDNVMKLISHIEEGDVYEINHCINYSADTQNFNPISTYFKLSEKSPTPFNAFLKWDDKYVICASPERFLKLKNGQLISQPIKGTAHRSEQPIDDLKLKTNLLSSEKERAENMMIVDLVRNDLAMSAEVGTTKVEELFGIYSFQYVHQMISTVSARKCSKITAVEALKNAFPMGSMTGAPKSSALKLIEQYEQTKRNLFSGSIGYFNGPNEFDFNVVIRSIFYDAKNNKLNYQVGGAITYDSDPYQEYEECLLKAKAIAEILKG